MGQKKDSRHHRKCRANGGPNEASNIKMVTIKAHQCWHYLFKSFEAPVIASIINNNWLDKDWKLVAVRREVKK